MSAYQGGDGEPIRLEASAEPESWRDILEMYSVHATLYANGHCCAHFGRVTPGGKAHLSEKLGCYHTTAATRIGVLSVLAQAVSEALLDAKRVQEEGP